MDFTNEQYEEVLQGLREEIDEKFHVIDVFLMQELNFEVKDGMVLIPVEDWDFWMGRLGAISQTSKESLQGISSTLEKKVIKFFRRIEKYKNNTAAIKSIIDDFKESYEEWLQKKENKIKGLSTNQKSIEDKEK